MSDLSFKFEVNDLVDVVPRTWPGMNKPGGTARVKSRLIGENGSRLYGVSYILGGKEEGVDEEYFRIPTMNGGFVPRERKRSSPHEVDNDSASSASGTKKPRVESPRDSAAVAAAPTPTSKTQSGGRISPACAPPKSTDAGVSSNSKVQGSSAAAIINRNKGSAAGKSSPTTATAAVPNAGVDATAPSIVVRVSDKKFAIPVTMSLSELYAAYAQLKRVPQDTLNLTFNGRRIGDNETAQNLGIVDGNLISDETNVLVLSVSASSEDSTSLGAGHQREVMFKVRRNTPFAQVFDSYAKMSSVAADGAPGDFSPLGTAATNTPPSWRFNTPSGVRISPVDTPESLRLANGDKIACVQ